jgi:hypothetical protein
MRQGGANVFNSTGFCERDATKPRNSEFL